MRLLPHSFKVQRFDPELRMYGVSCVLPVSVGVSPVFLKFLSLSKKHAGRPTGCLKLSQTRVNLHILWVPEIQHDPDQDKALTEDDEDDDFCWTISPDCSVRC